MDIPLLKQFVLWRGEKRIVVGEEDLQTAKISSVLKVGLSETIVVQFAKMMKEEISISSTKELKISQC